MNELSMTPFLRLALIVDAAVSGATGLAMAALASQLAGPLSLPPALLLWSGAFMLPYAAALVVLARRDEVPVWAVWTVIAANVLWAADCVALVTIGKPAWVEPSSLGTAFVLLQAIVVAIFAEWQFVGMRRTSAAPRYA